MLAAEGLQHLDSARAEQTLLCICTAALGSQRHKNGCARVLAHDWLDGELKNVTMHGGPI